jgi:hypothetical protein
MLERTLAELEQPHRGRIRGSRERIEDSSAGADVDVGGPVDAVASQRRRGNEQ